MVYLFDTTEYEWDRVPYVSRELVSKQMNGVPLQESDIPKESFIEGPFDMPNISRPTRGFIFVSEGGRAALQKLAPGCVAFFPLNLKVPAKMRPAEKYYFIDILPRVQGIDWGRSATCLRPVRAPDGRESRTIVSPLMGGSTKVREVTPETPMIWRETDLNTSATHFFLNKGDIFVQDGLWEALNTEFPGQLVAKKFA